MSGLNQLWGRVQQQNRRPPNQFALGLGDFFNAFAPGGTSAREQLNAQTQNAFGGGSVGNVAQRQAPIGAAPGPWNSAQPVDVAGQPMMGTGVHNADYWRRFYAQGGQAPQATAPQLGQPGFQYDRQAIAANPTGFGQDVMGAMNQGLIDPRRAAFLKNRFLGGLGTPPVAPASTMRPLRGGKGRV
jgi:hypothetical protein